MHPHRRPRWHTALAASTAVPLALGLGLAAGPSPDPAAAARPLPASAASHAVYELTLVTGDRVVLERFTDGRHAVTIDPAQRADPVSFDTLDYGGQIYVLPSDAAMLVPDVLDRELFNLTKLVEYGYTDGTPMIVQYEGSGVAAPQSLSGLSVASTLASIDAVTATVTDGAWWRGTLGGSIDVHERGPTGLLAGIESVWLDERVEADLDESVPMIGAPDAWDAGFDGTSVTVAVLDTGIDDTHPDLAGKVVAAENFTEEEDTTDGHGHGTHVAGTVAGTGADSDGQLVGVAPGAELMNGKVLNSSGTGTVAGVIDGMEWAAGQGADVVNMSLGTDPTDGTDPLAQAVNTLTEEHDVLFVTAAGNSGPEARTIGSPASADAALSVGAVAKSGVMPSFSSRGPRLGDDAIKPEVTAPGVAIRSAALGSGYRSLSGTSMASPHVAGAAAILHQRDPDLSAAELKAVLTTTAVPRAGLDVYEQGGGRVDVASAFDAPIVATPAPLNLGFFGWPHDDAEPVQSNVTYTNRADQPISLDLSFEVANSGGDVPSEAMLSVSPDTVTVEPGSSAQVTVALDVTEGELGLYGGYLVATDRGAVVTRTPLGFHKEPEMQTLTVEGIARDGRPATGRSNFHVINVENIGTFAETGISFTDGVATLQVPTGTYAVMGLFYTYRDDFDGGGGEIRARTEQVWVSEPEVEVSEDTTVVLDARDASPVVVETPGHDSVLKTNPHDYQLIRVFRGSEEGGAFQFNTFTNYAHPIYATPTDPVSLGVYDFMCRQRLSAPPDLTLRVVEPEELTLQPIMLVQSPALDGEFETRLIDVGVGRPEDYEGIDATGAVVLTRLGGITNSAKANNAADAGAVAMLIANDAPGPLFRSSGSALPGIGLSMEEGDELLELLDAGEVTVHLAGDPSAPVLFDLVLTEEGHIRDDLTYVADPDELAALEIDYHTDVADEQRTGRHFWRHGATSSVGVEFPFTPLQRTEYLVPGDTMYRQNYVIAFPRGTMDSRHTFYESGEHRDVTWNKKPFRPGIRGADALLDGDPTVRDGNLLRTDIREWVDAHGNGNWGFNDPSIDTTAFRLFTDGELTAEAERAIGTFALSPDPATYRLELDVARDADWWLTSTQTRTAWTVHSDGPTAGPEALPLLLVDYDVELDLLNTAPHPRDRSGPATVGLRVDHQPGVDGPPVVGARAWISYDDGATWRPRPTLRLGDGAFDVILDSRDPIDTTGFASLRVEAWDADGNRIEQEITRAWRLTPR